VFESISQSNKEVHIDQCSIEDFKPLHDYIYMNRCESDELLQSAYQTFVSCGWGQKLNPQIRLVESESHDFSTQSRIIAHDTPVMSSSSNNRNLLCDVMSDDDLFSSFSNKSRNRSEEKVKKSPDIDGNVTVDLTESDSEENSSEEILHEFNAAFNQSKQDYLKSSHVDEANSEFVNSETTSSKINQSASDLSIINQSEEHSELNPSWDRVFGMDQSNTSTSLPRSSLSQPLPDSEKLSVDDVTMSQPVPTRDENDDLSINDSVLLRTAMQLDTSSVLSNSMKTPVSLTRKRVPITPMPNFSDMETPEIVNRVSLILEPRYTPLNLADT